MVTQAQVKNSLECKWRLRQCKLYLGAWAFCAAIAPFFVFLKPVKAEHFDAVLKGILIAELIIPIYILPFVLYYYIRYLQIVRNYRRYRMNRVKLDRPNTSWMYRGAIYYRVEFQDGEKYRSLDTKPLWTSHADPPFRWDDYRDREADILYDEKTDRVIVLGLAE